MHLLNVLLIKRNKGFVVFQKVITKDLSNFRNRSIEELLTVSASDGPEYILINLQLAIHLFKHLTR